MASERTKIANSKVTPAEHALIRGKARAAGETLSNYLRRLALGHKLRAERPVVEHDLVHQLARLGNNLNQLTRLAHARQLPNAEALERRLKDLLRLLSVVADRLAELRR